MSTKRIEADALPPIERLTLDCDGQVNPLIGPNVSGKRTILQGLKYFCSLRLGPVEVDEYKAGYSHIFRDGPELSSGARYRSPLQEPATGARYRSPLQEPAT